MNQILIEKRVKGYKLSYPEQYKNKDGDTVYFNFKTHFRYAATKQQLKSILMELIDLDPTENEKE